MKKSKFNTLVENLKANGYTVNVSTTEEGYKFAFISGNGIHGGFCKPNKYSYTAINGRVAFEHVDCFDKWSKCPYSFPFPKNDSEFNYLLSKMKYLGTDEGFKKSDEFDIDYEDDYPESIGVSL